MKQTWSFSMRMLVAVLRIVLATTPSLGAAAELEVRIDGVRGSDGRLMIEVLASPAAFAGEEPSSAAVILPAVEGTARFSTNALAAGTYAVRVMHDRNGNGELDDNLVGIPTEPWGFSNDAAGTFGPPGFQAAAFELPDTGTSITIHLNQ